MPNSTKLRWVLPLSYMTLIWYLSAQPPSRLDLGFLVSDKLMHTVAYGALALFVWWAAEGLRHRSIVAFTVTTLYGGVDELHQLWGAAGRYGDVWDWAADGFGALIMVTFVSVWSRRTARREGSGETALPEPGAGSGVIGGTKSHLP